MRVNINLFVSFNVKQPEQKLKLDLKGHLVYLKVFEYMRQKPFKEQIRPSPFPDFTNTLNLIHMFFHKKVKPSLTCIYLFLKFYTNL